MYILFIFLYFVLFVRFTEYIMYLLYLPILYTGVLYMRYNKINQHITYLLYMFTHVKIHVHVYLLTLNIFSNILNFVMTWNKNKVVCWD